MAAARRRQQRRGARPARWRRLLVEQFEPRQLLAPVPLADSYATPEDTCFDIGWDAGFRGPWCFEHSHLTLAGLYRALAMLCDQLRQWIAARHR